MAKLPASQSLDPKLIDKVLDDKRESREVNVSDSDTNQPKVNIDLSKLPQPFKVKVVGKPKRRKVKTIKVAVWLIVVEVMLAAVVLASAVSMALVR